MQKVTLHSWHQFHLSDENFLKILSCYYSLNSIRKLAIDCLLLSLASEWWASIHGGGKLAIVNVLGGGRERRGVSVQLLYSVSYWVG